MAPLVLQSSSAVRRCLLVPSLIAPSLFVFTNLRRGCADLLREGGGERAEVEEGAWEETEQEDGLSNDKVMDEKEKEKTKGLALLLV